MLNDAVGNEMNIIDIWVNCPSEECADQISDHLISVRLAACTNVFPAISSRYYWKNRVEHEREHPLLIKTRESLGDKVEEAVKYLHPYETPSIIRLAIDHVNEDYAKWVYAETSE